MAKDTCATCWWADWAIGGRCVRPPIDMMARVHWNVAAASGLRQMMVENLDAPAVRKKDFCGDHVTGHQIKVRANPAYKGKAIWAGSRAGAAVPAANVDHQLLAVLKAKSQRQAS